LAVCWLALLLLPACATVPAGTDAVVERDQQRITELNQDILALAEDIDPREARLAATLAIRYSRELAQQYRITDSAITHNLKVNLGLRERGLCTDWTEDLLARLRQEHFQTLDLHWAIANYETAFRLEHSSVVVSPRHASIFEGLVLDPWRHTGELYWSATTADRGYPWRPYDDVMALKRTYKAAAQTRRAPR
jgi:hypothetical protein